jgi:hypothetical protein
LGTRAKAPPRRERPKSVQVRDGKPNKEDGCGRTSEDHHLGPLDTVTLVHHAEAVAEVSDKRRVSYDSPVIVAASQEVVEAMAAESEAPVTMIGEVTGGGVVFLRNGEPLDNLSGWDHFR